MKIKKKVKKMVSVTTKNHVIPALHTSNPFWGCIRCGRVLKIEMKISSDAS